MVSELHPLHISHTCRCPSCSSCKPICFANSTPTVTQDILFLSSLSRGGGGGGVAGIYVFTERATALLAQVSCSPALGGHLCLASVPRYLSAPHLWTAASVASQIPRTFSHYHALLGCTLKSLLPELTDSFQCCWILESAAWLPKREPH